MLKYFFDFGWTEPADIFFFKLIITHDYIMCFLILVLMIVTWLLRIIIYNFYWGELFTYRSFGWKLRYRLLNIFRNYLFFVQEWTASMYHAFCFMIIYFFNFLFFHIFLGGRGQDTKILGIPFYLVDYFINEKMSDSLVSFVFFIAGPFSITRGYYLEADEAFEFAGFTEIECDEWLDILAEERHENYILKKTRAIAFMKTDGIEKYYSLQKWRHSFNLELFWAISPSIIITLILGPSLILLYSSAALKYSDFNVNVSANQWFWNYDYSTGGSSCIRNCMVPVNNANAERCYPVLKTYGKVYMLSIFRAINFNSTQIHYDACAAYDSFMIEMDEHIKKGLVKRLLDTTQHIKAPALAAVKFSVTSNDVLHSFSLNSIGVKIDAVTGRVNDMTVFLSKEGILIGQCSELCGAGHYGMPIVLESLWPFDFQNSSEEDFWTNSMPFLGNCPLFSKIKFAIPFYVEERLNLDPYLKVLKTFYEAEY